MSLLFGGKPEEVPLRRKILRVLVFAASKASTFLILEPVLQGKHCSDLPSARAYLIVFAILCIAGLPLQLFNNIMRIKSGLNPSINCDIHSGESELYAGHKIVPRQRPRLFEFDGAGRGDGADAISRAQVSNIDKLLGLATLLVGVFWGLSIWSIQTSRGGANSKCDKGIYSAVGVSAWICVAIFVAILVYIALIVAGVVPNPKKEKAPLEAPLDAEASAE